MAKNLLLILLLVLLILLISGCIKYYDISFDFRGKTNDDINQKLLEVVIQNKNLKVFNILNYSYSQYPSGQRLIFDFSLKYSRDKLRCYLDLSKAICIHGFSCTNWSEELNQCIGDMICEAPLEKLEFNSMNIRINSIECKSLKACGFLPEEKISVISNVEEGFSCGFHTNFYGRLEIMKSIRVKNCSFYFPVKVIETRWKRFEEPTKEENKITQIINVSVGDKIEIEGILELTTCTYESHLGEYYLIKNATIKKISQN